MPKLTDRLRRGWNAFRNNKDPSINDGFTYGEFYGGSFTRPDRLRLSIGNERSIINAIYNRIAIDTAAMDIRHVRIDENEQFIEEIYSGLDNCLRLDANPDQTGFSFMEDVVLSLFDEGCIAIVPVDASEDIRKTDSYDIYSLRTGSITQWYPNQVRVKLYNDRNGLKEELTLPKKCVAIVENPFYSIMNEPNSTLKRLIRKLVLLDAVDAQNGAGKLDMIIQLPYVIKSQLRQEQAEARRKALEEQLANSKYGIAYADGTEKIIQLNRSVDNQLLQQVEYLTKLLMSQLGITDEILNGTANEQTMLNYYNRCVEPILCAITSEMRRKFLTKTARTQGQSIMYFRDAFKLVPVNNIAEIADKFTRNAILSSNEIRGIIGFRPSNEAIADELSNKNLNRQILPEEEQQNSEDLAQIEADISELDAFDEALDDLEYELSGESSLEHTGATGGPYASPYYDPVKAHEYYEAHKKLKGRRSTSGLNETGRKAALYVRNQLNDERDEKIQSHKELRDFGIQSSRMNRDEKIDKDRKTTNDKIEQHKKEMNANIKRLRQELSDMSKEEKAANREQIQAKISSLREQNRTKKESLKSVFNILKGRYDLDYRNQSNELRDNHRIYSRSTREQYERMYEDELDKMRSDPNLTTKKK